jgi:hypothetical protein
MPEIMLSPSSTASNNGMHPTADTTVLMFLQSLVAAGDAERYVAIWKLYI